MQSRIIFTPHRKFLWGEEKPNPKQSWQIIITKKISHRAKLSDVRKETSHQVTMNDLPTKGFLFAQIFFFRLRLSHQYVPFVSVLLGP